LRQGEVILDKILEVKRAEVAALKKNQGFAMPDLSGLPPSRDFLGALKGKSCAVIAEVKRKSPSKGLLREGLDPVKLASEYEQSGAAAISVLTDSQFFGGSTDDLRKVKASAGIPVLRKDFIIDPCQIHESRMIGADAVLLIARILDRGALREYIDMAKSLGMVALVEIHDRPDAEKAVAAGAEIIGINNRDLSSFVTDIRTTLGLLPFIPADRTVVSESGINTHEDIALLQDAGVRAFLIGEALVKAGDPGLKLREFLGR
jgi:indole-3-glycerol phosphate synthase